MSGNLLLLLRIAGTAVLYAFLLVAFWIIWQDLRRQSSQGAAPQAPELVLTLPEREYRFTSPVVLIGRDPLCECSLADKTISSRHTRLAYHHKQWWVEDLRSKNGTFLNGMPIQEAMVVTSGDQLRCGQVVIAITMVELANQPEE